ncbi:hypothetical protein ACP70R_039145 [Stipagrostis hirtigluma subsp. patula]
MGVWPLLRPSAQAERRRCRRPQDAAAQAEGRRRFCLQDAVLSGQVDLHGGPAEPQAHPLQSGGAAAVCRAAGEPLTIKEIVVHPPKAYEIRIKITCTSLCHTDITFWRAKAPPLAAFPRILGHEPTGTVVESVGEHAEEFAVGDAMAPTFIGQCDRCSSCA